jgi:hypothetical protein
LTDAGVVARSTSGSTRDHQLHPLAASEPQALHREAERLELPRRVVAGTPGAEAGGEEGRQREHATPRRPWLIVVDEEERRSGS